MKQQARKAKQVNQCVHITNPQILVVRYSTGTESLRAIASSIGRSDHWLRIALHKELGSSRYRALVLNVLLGRIARSHGKRLKHSIWALKRIKPFDYAKLKEKMRPKRCSSCSKPIQARLSSGLWIWSCEHCGKGGIERMLLR